MTTPDSARETIVMKHDEARRTFLVGTAAAAAGLAQNVPSQPAGAQPAQVQPAQVQPAQVQTPSPQPAAEHLHTMASRLGAFLNADDSAALDAFTERLMPGEPGIPGARDAGVRNYIDLPLAGAYADLQDFYRPGP